MITLQNRKGEQSDGTNRSIGASVSTIQQELLSFCFIFIVVSKTVETKYCVFNYIE